MTDKIKRNQNGGLAELRGDLLLLDILHRINERAKIVERPAKPGEEANDD